MDEIAIGGTVLNTPVTSNLVFAGDCLPGRAFCLPRWVPSGAAIGNLEAVISSREETSTGKAYAVRLGPESVEHLKASGFSAFNVANNHVYDAGPQAFDEMLEILEELETVQIFGTTDRPFAELELEGRRVAVIGCVEPCRSRGPRLFREEHVTPLIRSLRDQVSHVFVSPHWGKEGEFAHHPSPRQRRLAEKWIEAGARGVFGHHTHTVHGKESFGDAPVYYSLGNFAFDHVEGDRYPATRLKLVVTFDVLTDAFTEYLYTEDPPGEAREAGSAELEFFESISDDLASWDSWRWARMVGPIYIPKSEASWVLRIARDPARTRLLRTIWNLLPGTLLLRLGAAFPDRSWLSRQSRIHRILSGSS